MMKYDSPSNCRMERRLRNKLPSSGVGARGDRPATEFGDSVLHSAGMSMIRLMVFLTGIAVAAAIALPGCYYPYPAPAPVTVSGGGPASFDKSWQAARGAAYDEGVRITFEDRATGTLRGDQGSFKVVITVAPQANGSVQVAFSVTGPQSEGAGLQDQLTRAYQRRMGR